MLRTTSGASGGGFGLFRAATVLYNISTRHTHNRSKYSAYHCSLKMDEHFEKATADFLSWLRTVGTKTSQKMEVVDLRSKGRGRGIVAIEPFAEGEEICSILRTSVLTVENVITNDNTGFLNSRAQVLAGMPSWLALTAVMIFESANPNSIWSEYFEVLPEELDSLVFWSQEELTELQASSVLQKISKSNAEEMFEQHLAPLGLANYSVELCHRVASTIMAYAFDVPDLKTEASNEEDGDEDGDDLVSDNGDDDEKTVLTMIPLADMFNADADRNNARLCPLNSDMLSMVATKPIAAGEEIFNDYGELPQSDLLRRYGYTSDRYQIYDVVEVPTDLIISTFRSSSVLPKAVRLSEQDLQTRVELARREDVYEESYDLTHAGPNGPSIPVELLALIYILLVNDENLASILSSQSSLPGSRSRLTTQLAGQVLVTILKEREREYGTTLEEDHELLQRGDSAPRKTMAINVRLGEKLVLREAIQEANGFGGDNKSMKVSTKATGKRTTEEIRSPPKKRSRHR